MEKTKVCDLINNAIDKIREGQFMTLNGNKINGAARLIEAERLLLSALTMIGGGDAE